VGPPDTQAGPIAVYGATGYTGKLVARELTRRGADFVLAGRSASKLGAVAQELGTEAPVRPASLDDRDALRHAFGDCAAVINCAGPFVRYGEPVVRAAVETGTHYIDTTGEQPYIRFVYERLDDAAQAAEVALVPAMGFDYVPGDMICRLAAREHEPLEKLVVAYCAQGFAATRGTLHSGLEMMRAGGLEYRDGELRDLGLRPRRAHFTFPEPLGRQTMMPYPSGEVLSVPRHTSTRNVVSLVNASVAAPPGVPPGIVPFSAPALALALHTPAKAVADLAIDRLPEGPSEEQRRASRFTIVALAHGADGRTGRGLVRGTDVYALTAGIAVHGATLMASPDYDRAGALGPASAFEPVEFLDHLAEYGVSWEADGVTEEAAV
jgi:short subunit dehydrogenase-like uncharacterized protein